ncbi:hypothetical protein FHG87_017177 [Trinorchestia longiramus]|nr:hypothetical protein FHG87_017177 [Trinorchestia longiramus]
MNLFCLNIKPPIVFHIHPVTQSKISHLLSVQRYSSVPNCSRCYTTRASVVADPNTTQEINSMQAIMSYTVQVKSVFMIENSHSVNAIHIMMASA